MLAYLFHRIEDRLDGRPTLLIIDEGWLALDDRGFAGQLREWLKTLRKKNATVIFATQSLADIDGCAIAPAIIESCPTRLFLPNERALEPQIAAIYRRFGLNDRQIEILSRATPKRDYYCQSRRGNRLFELGLSEVALAFTAASSKTDQAAIAEILAANGRDGFAAAWLRAKGLDWAADMLTTPARRPPHDPPSPARRACGRRRRSHARRSERAGARAMDRLRSRPTISQNVLTAARELQQVNNEIQSLENQATMLINQAQNLASLPYSSLAPARAVDHPDPAAPHPGAAHRLQRQHDRPGLHADLSAGLFQRDLVAAASSPTRRPAGRTRSPDSRTPCASRPAWCRISTSTRTQIDALVSSSQSATGALQAAQSGNQLVALQTKQLADLTAVMAAIARAQSLEGARTGREPGAGAAAAPELPQLRRRLSARLRADVPLMRGRLLDIRASAGRRASSLVAAAIVATTLHFDRHEGGAGADDRSTATIGRSARRRTRALPGDRHRGAERRRLRGGLGREPAPLLHLPPPSTAPPGRAAAAGGPKTEDR